ncbi:hypothetical protein LTR62_003189 [Meristemomyces frigidus]|uniref:Major facilitator superfamily (MFS) profile domain-containing protein n=1 Tax=Meristemomyces frigidus TaxID=1508187 RepID=A0AAN7TQ05_9PEZI|nr:hypothetical protein LTR62_003189 [Meristemomyces frigidus]
MALEKESSKDTPASSHIGSVSTAVETTSSGGPLAFAALAAPDLNQDVAQHGRWPKGWKPWVTLISGFLLMFNSWGYINAYGTYATLYKSETVPHQWFLSIAMIGGTQEFLVLLLSMIVGRLVDANHHAKVITIGTILVALGMFLQTVVHAQKPDSQTTTFALLWLTQGFITGLGMSCFFVTSSQVVATWFVEAKSFAVGVVACGASVGGTIYSVMLKYLEVELGAWRATACVAAVMVLTSIATIVFARPNPNTKHENSLEWRWSTFWDREAFNNAAYTWFVTGFAFMFTGFYPIFFTLEEWATESSIGYRGRFRPENLPSSAMATFALLAIMNGSSFLGRVSSATISDMLGSKHGALHVHAVVTGICTILVLVMWPLTKTTAVAVGFVLVFGAFSGSVIALPPASVAYIIGKHNQQGQKKLGQWVGMMYTLASLPAIAGVVVSGLLVDLTGSFLPTQLFCGGCFAVATVCMGMAIWHKHREMGGMLEGTVVMETKEHTEVARSGSSSMTLVERVV